MSGVPALASADFEYLVRRALEEDIGAGDVTTRATIPADLAGRGTLMAKSPLVVAGLDVARAAFDQVAQAPMRFEVRSPDGTSCRPGVEIARVEGPAAVLLTAERTAVNFLQRLSGIATLTRQYVEAAGGRITILDTRKTTPTLRRLEKYAVRVGGGMNHRAGLFDQILIKDNHIRLAGGVERAIRAARSAGARVVEVEAQTLREVEEALASGANVILLDNLSLADIRDAVRLIAGRARVEISGGVTLDGIPALSETGADDISVGALTHSAPAVDISFEIEPA